MKTAKSPKKAATALFASAARDLRRDFTPKKALSSSVTAASISRRGYSKKAASRDRPAGRSVGKPKIQTGSGPGSPVR